MWHVYEATVCLCLKGGCHMNDWEIFTLLVVLCVAIVLVFLVVLLVVFLNGFTAELRYLNMEIERTTGKEREHYIEQKRRLWLSLIPFVRYR